MSRFHHEISELVIIHRASHPVRLRNILRRLRQESAQHLKVSVHHQLVRAEHIYSSPSTGER